MKVIIRLRPDTCDLLNHKGQTVVHAAVLGEKAAVIKYILKTPELAGLVNEADNDGNTPLHLAALKQNLIVILPFATDPKVDKTATNNHRSKAVDIFLGDNIALLTFGRRKILRLLGRSIGVPNFQRYVHCDFTELESHEEKKDTSTTAPIENNKSVKALLDDSKFFDTNLLVAMLIATVTFAAAFTIPGGFNSSNGMAILHPRIFFIVFVLLDAISFALSIFVVYNHFILSTVSRIFRATPAIFIRYSIVAMVVAFGSGMIVVLPEYSPFGILVILICSTLCYIIIQRIRCASPSTQQQFRTRNWLRSRII